MQSLLKFFSALLLVIPLGAVAQQPNAGAQYLRDNYRKQEVRIPMRDGVELHTALYIPKDAGKGREYPFLVTRTPYSCRPYGPEAYAQFVSPSQEKLLREGFIMVTQDVRGRWESGGDYVHVRPQAPEPDKKKQKTTDESTDSYDTFDWLVKNIPGNNGRIGVFGVSYPGFYTTAAALSNHPALKAVSPQAPVTEWFIGDDVHHNGAFFWMDFYNFLPWFANDDYRQWNNPAWVSQVRPRLEPAQDNYDYFLNYVQTPRRAQELFRDTISFWNDILAHPDYDAYWKSRNPIPHALNLKPAVLTVGGWYDAEDLYGALATYRGIEGQNPGAQNQLVMGPWCHGCWWGSGSTLGDISFKQNTGAYYLDSLFLPFMLRHLKQAADAPALPEAAMFETGTNRWHRFSQWPPAGVQKQTWYLTGTGGVHPAASQAGKLTYVSDPSRPVPYEDGIRWDRTTSYMIADQRFASRRPDVLTFQTEPITQPMTLAGPIEATLYVSMDATDADFIVKVIDVHPTEPDTADFAKKDTPLSGYQQLVRFEVMRGRYRNSHERPEPFVAGAVTPVTIVLPDLFHTFRPGHRLMVQMQSSMFPLIDRNPQQYINIYQAQPADYRAATINVHTGGSQASAIRFTTLPR